MEEHKDIINSFSDALSSGDGHVNEPALSLYINFHNNLSTGEKTFVEKHLAACADCRERFERVFDDELDLDSQRIEIPLTAASDGHGSANVLSDRAQDFILHIRPDKKGGELLFASLPYEYRGEKMSLRIAEKRIRIVCVQENEPIGIPGGLKANEQLLSVTLTALRREAAAAAEQELRPVFMRYVRYLAAAVFVVVAGGLLYESLNRHEEMPQAVDTKKEVRPDSAQTDRKVTDERTQTPEIKKTPEKTRSAILAENYTPNDVLENFVNRQYRAGAAEIVTPNNSDTLSSPIRFKWKEMEGIHSFIVVVVDNKNEEMWRGSTGSYELTCDLKFRSGLYYWMLKTDGDILSVRKFFVL